MKYAPVIIFTFNRPEHLKQTLSALKNNMFSTKTDIFFFSDSARRPEDEKNVNEVRDVINNVQGFNSITVTERSENYGLAKNIIAGVTEVIDQYGKCIVLEDDMITSKFFLKYMNDGLDLYQEDEEVASIHGYIYPVKENLPDTFFIRGADCWGWATYKRSWDLFEPDGEKLLKKIDSHGLREEFDFYGSYPFYRMLLNQVKGKVNSWAIRWYASMFLANKYTLYPGKSLVQNIGTDGSGSHSLKIDAFNHTFINDELKLKKIDIRESLVAKKVISNYFLDLARQEGNIFKKILRKIKQK